MKMSKLLQSWEKIQKCSIVVFKVKSCKNGSTFHNPINKYLLNMKKQKNLKKYIHKSKNEES